MGKLEDLIFDIRFDYDEDAGGNKVGTHSDEYYAQQIKDLMLELIGEDEAPDTKTAKRSKDGTRVYVPAYSLRAQFINETKAQQRQKVQEL